MMTNSAMSILIGGLLLGGACLSPAAYANGAANDPASNASTWNLATDIARTGNQISFDQGANGVWYFMESRSLRHGPLSYRFISDYYAPGLLDAGEDGPNGRSCWEQPVPATAPKVPNVCFNFNDVTVSGENGYKIPPKSIDMHPGTNQYTIVAWRSPMRGLVGITGSFADLNPQCGDGVRVSIDKVGETLWSTDVPNGGSADFSLSGVSVRNGIVLYFIVDPGATYYCDSTNLKVTIKRE